MKKRTNFSIGRIIGLAVLFVIILAVTFVLATISRRKEEISQEEMRPAKNPTITVFSDPSSKTELFGYAVKMDLKSMRDTILPISENRELNILLRTYGNPVSSLSYEVRSVDGEEFFDTGEISSGGEEEEEFTITLSSLLKNNEEYQIVFIAECDENRIYYYTRVIPEATHYLTNMMSFATEFSESTRNPEKADFIVNHIQPSDDSATNDYSHITIHSKYAMFTYGGLTVRRTGEICSRISEFSPTQMSVTFEYPITIVANGEDHNAFVSEFFCVRYRNERVYLLDYDRTVEENLNKERVLASNGRILLGITGDASVTNSPKGNYTTFVKNRELWCYDSSENKLSLVFSFRDEEDLSNRSNYSHHQVQSVKITDDGELDYLVYGYMNRGAHEGKVGISFYHYNAKTGISTRLFYLPVVQSELRLLTDLGTLNYVNRENIFYLRYGDGIYSINLDSGESVEVSVRAYPGAYAKNERGNVVAWTEGEDFDYPDRLVILNMDTQTTMVVSAEEHEYVKILDFIGNDIVYGFGRKENSLLIANMEFEKLLCRVLIASVDDKLTVREEYEETDGFISEIEVYDMRIVIHRVRKKSFGSMEEFGEKILLVTAKTQEEEGFSLLSRQNGDLKIERYIQLGKNTLKSPVIQYTLPRFSEKGSSKDIVLSNQQENRFYVFAHGKLKAVESKLSSAIKGAYEDFGTVVDSSMRLCWNRSTRDLVKTIPLSAISARQAGSSLAAGLLMLAGKEGQVLTKVQEALQENVSPADILNALSEEKKIYNLSGLSISELFYFLGKGNPLLVIRKDSSCVVLTGYNRDNVILYNPVTDEVYEISSADFEEQYEKESSLRIAYW